ncbi:hypothetical protein E4U43_005883 [Claviceps pusilla]|uniref:Uncharacterized protein n=1 Tax=Claviceps pusilla TaxID=123648 RepID=A0A9P7N3M8_9HYPO|nr:hypothetical protein E4U43_005883 [Claviceps pusilla]
MNTIVTRAAARRFLTTSTTRRTVQAHPLPRLPRRTAPTDWAGEGKRLGKQAALVLSQLTMFLPNRFFPAIVMLLGWPAFAKTVFDGHV